MGQCGANTAEGEGVHVQSRTLKSESLKSSRYRTTKSSGMLSERRGGGGFLPSPVRGTWNTKISGVQPETNPAIHHEGQEGEVEKAHSLIKNTEEVWEIPRPRAREITKIKKADGSNSSSLTIKMAVQTAYFLKRETGGKGGKTMR